MTTSAASKAEAPITVAGPAADGTTGAPHIRPRRDAIAAGLVVLVVSALGLGVIYFFARRAQIDAVHAELLQLARVAATRVDPALHARLDRPELEGGRDYQRAVAPLVDLIRATDDVFYLYTGILRDGRVHFVLDTATVYRRPGAAIVVSHLMDEYDGPDRDFARALASGVEVVNDHPQPDQYGDFLTAYAPFHDGAGRLAGVVGADMRVQAVDERVARVRRIAVFAGLAMALLAALVAVVVYRMRLAAAGAVERAYERLRALADARDAAEQSVRARSTFVAMMSHELRTPLNAIVGYSELIHDDLTDRGELRLADDVGRVHAAGRHLAAIISDILDYSKLEADRLVLSRESVRLPALLRDIVEHQRREADARGLTLAVEVAPGVDTIDADPVRLQQVVVNLLSNAVKFTDRGRVVLRARLAPGGGRVVVTVHDTGLGIPANKRDRLFQPFSQVDGSLTRRAGGTGLGLVISHRLVVAFGGTLRVRSRVGHGSTFRVSLPLAPTRATEAA